MSTRKKAALLIIVSLIGYLWVLYYRLDIGEVPVSADIIIVNEGVGPERANRGVELMQQGYADQIIVSPPFSESENVIQWYYDAGAAAEDIIPEPYATSTWTNALYTIEIMEEKGWTSALVVSSDYHMRRIQLSFERAARGKDLDFTYVSAYPTDEGEHIRYMNHPINSQVALNELWKYPGYLLGLYHFFDL